jgi:1,4-dihydroxy-2-naphthoyl-CoA synthase
LPYEAILHDKRHRIATIALNRPEVLIAFPQKRSPPFY